MSNIKFHNRKWPKGPWDDEPNEEMFEHDGFQCVILRNGMGALCGYVVVPASHPIYQDTWQNLTSLDVHGGITFSETGKYFNKHVASFGIENIIVDNNSWVIGFDTCHWNDYIPGIPSSASPKYYKTFEYVKNEIINLVKQLKFEDGL